MTTENDPDTDRNRDAGEPKREATAVAPASTGSALTSLSKLDAMLSHVNIASIIGRSTGRPIMQFHSRDGHNYTYGQTKTVIEPGSRWAPNPLSFRWGWVCWDDNKKATEKMVSISQPMPAKTELPDTGFEWQPQMDVGMKCLDGQDADVEVVFKTNTDGGKQALGGLIEKVRSRLESGQHGGNVVPIVTLDDDSYPHPKYSRIWVPVLTVVGWMPLDGPAPAPAPVPPSSPTPPASAAEQQPRRRRVA
jgi:hypothetical protein